MTIKEIIQKLNTTIADHRGHESHGKSWLTLIEGIIDAIDALKALDKQEPVAWISTGPARMIHWTADKPDYGDDWVPLYTTPPQRKPLTYEQVDSLWQTTDTGDFELDIREFARAIEAAHNIKE